MTCINHVTQIRLFPIPREFLLSHVDNVDSPGGFRCSWSAPLHSNTMSHKHTSQITRLSNMNCINPWLSDVANGVAYDTHGCGCVLRLHLNKTECTMTSYRPDKTLKVTAVEPTWVIVPSRPCRACELAWKKNKHFRRRSCGFSVFTTAIANKCSYLDGLDSNDSIEIEELDSINQPQLTTPSVLS